MYKLISFVCALFFCSVSLFADVVLDVEGKTQKYPDGSILNVTAAKNLYVGYYGIRVFVPKNEKITLRCSDNDENNVIFCTSDKFKNIKIGNTVISTDKQTSFSVSQNGDLQVENGTLVLVDEKGNVAILEQGNSYRVSSIIIPSDSVPAINEKRSVFDDNKYDQVLEDRRLSPSAPRN